MIKQSILIGAGSWMFLTSCGFRGDLVHGDRVMKKRAKDQIQIEYQAPNSPIVDTPAPDPGIIDQMHEEQTTNQIPVQGLDQEPQAVVPDPQDSGKRDSESPVGVDEDTRNQTH
ncbi:MAG: hypothetical protein IPP74_03415 [Alphaproteobacteria bacterium]|nr:hypothetical protein [Alphaproteobacteria bacterium]